MAAVGSITETLKPVRTYGIRELTLAWLSHTDGTVSGIYTGKFSEGEILKVTFVPGSATPTDNYDVTCLDSNGIDVFLGRGANRSSTVTQQVVPILNDGQATPQYFGRNFAIGPVQLVVANAGSQKTGSVIITFK